MRAAGKPSGTLDHSALQRTGSDFNATGDGHRMRDVIGSANKSVCLAVCCLWGFRPQSVRKYLWTFPQVDV